MGSACAWALVVVHGKPQLLAYVELVTCLRTSMQAGPLWGAVANAILHPPSLKGWPQKDPLRGRAANSVRARSSVVVYGKAHLLVAR